MRRVLVTDDDAEICKLIANRLRGDGFQAASQLDGRAGLAEAKRWKPDVVILDLVLPKLSGLDVCSAIRRDAKLNATAIIILSGRGDEIDRVTCLEVGSDDFVVKPFSLRELVARVRALVRRWERATAPDTPLEAPANWCSDD